MYCFLNFSLLQSSRSLFILQFTLLGHCMWSFQRRDQQHIFFSKFRNNGNETASFSFFLLNYSLDQSFQQLDREKEMYHQFLLHIQRCKLRSKNSQKIALLCREDKNWHSHSFLQNSFASVIEMSQPREVTRLKFTSPYFQVL